MPDFLFGAGLVEQKFFEQARGKRIGFGIAARRAVAEGAGIGLDWLRRAGDGRLVVRVHSAANNSRQARKIHFFLACQTAGHRQNCRDESACGSGMIRRSCSHEE